MELFTTVVLALAGSLIFVAFGAFAVTSAQEREGRAAKISLAVAFIGAVVVVAGAFAPLPAKEALAALLVVAALSLLALFLAPLGKVDVGPRIPQGRKDERDIMYSRVELKPGTPQYDSYYEMRPEKKDADDRMRSLPGLLSPESLMANPLPFGAADASFGVTMSLVGELDGEPATERSEVEASEITPYLKGLARYWGARSAGVAELQPHHVYSHRGMDQDRYGEPLEEEHRFAIALAIELEHEMLSAGPEAPIIMESGRSYLTAATAAIQLAAHVRLLGYGAAAHIVDHYSMIAPLVARDAGLGEIGRNGILLTPELGPRVRLSFVTTDLPLEPDTWQSDASVLDFCNICRKCAEACPSQSIPTGDRQIVDGALRWTIEPESCFRYWCSLGTDCGRCVSVCPHSHPDTFMHNVVRWANRRSGAARRATLYLDDVFYGRKPAPQPGPAWVPKRPKRH